VADREAVERAVDKYYERVKEWLEVKRVWDEVLKAFPAPQIKLAVRRILERLLENDADPEEFPWEESFELLKDHITVEGFLDELEGRGYLPRSRGEAVERAADELERELLQLLDQAERVERGFLEKRLMPRILDRLGERHSLTKMMKELAELRHEAYRSKEVAAEYSRKIEELRAQLAKLRAENEALRRELERARAAAPRGAEELRRRAGELKEELEGLRRKVGELRRIASPLEKRNADVQSKRLRSHELERAGRLEEALEAYKSLLSECEKLSEEVDEWLYDFNALKDDVNRRIDRIKREVRELSEGAKRLGVWPRELNLEEVERELSAILSDLAKITDLNLLKNLIETEYKPLLRSSIRRVEELLKKRVAPPPAPPAPPAPPEAEAEKYFGRIKAKLEGLGLWRAVTAKFLEGDVRRAVADLLEVLRRERVSPEAVDWGRVAELLAESRSIPEFTAKALEVIRRPPPPKVKILPAVPEACPIDGTRLSKLTKISVTRPDGTVELIDVPPTMEVYRCEMGHLFERDPVKGVIYERTPAYLAQKMYREMVREEKVMRARLALPVTILRPGEVVYADFRVWLHRVKGMTVEEFAKLPDAEKKRLIDEWLASRGMKRR